jgi:hypothetical protein
MTALFITPPQRGTAQFLRVPRTDTTADFFLSVSVPQKAYIGPKDYDRLRAFGHEAKKVINFGFFGAITEIEMMEDIIASGKADVVENGARPACRSLPSQEGDAWPRR